MNPCQNFSDGLLGKITELEINSDTAVLTLTEPELAEVFKSIDISAEFHADERNFMNDGELVAVDEPIEDEVTAVLLDADTTAQTAASGAVIAYDVPAANENGESALSETAQLNPVEMIRTAASETTASTTETELEVFTY